jgi:hypothetical protein
MRVEEEFVRQSHVYIYASTLPLTGSGDKRLAFNRRDLTSEHSLKHRIVEECVKERPGTQCWSMAHQQVMIDIMNSQLTGKDGDG